MSGHAAVCSVPKDAMEKKEKRTLIESAAVMIVTDGRVPLAMQHCQTGVCSSSAILQIAPLTQVQAMSIVCWQTQWHRCWLPRLLRVA